MYRTLGGSVVAAALAWPAIAYAPSDNLNSVEYVGDGTNRPGDIGAQINAAYASLPRGGGTLVINPPANGGCYNFSVPINFTTLGKYPVLVGNAPGGASVSEGTCLNYTPRTATAAITLDYATTTVGITAVNSGLRDITLFNNNCITSGGCGSLATGINIGTTNGGDANSTYTRVTIEGFKIGYNELNTNPSVAGEQWIVPNFIANSTALIILGANEKFVAGQLSGNGKIFLAPRGSRQSELYFSGSTFVSNSADPVFDYTAATAPAFIDLSQVHLENSPALTGHFFTGCFNLTSTAGEIEDDDATGTGDWMVKPTCSQAVITMQGTALVAARRYASVVNLPTFTRVNMAPIVDSPSTIAVLVNGAFASSANIMPLTNSRGSPLQWTILPETTFGRGMFTETTTLANLLAVHPCTSAAEKGLIAGVVDAKAPRWNAPIVGGGTSTVLAVCTGAGGIWTAHASEHWVHADASAGSHFVAHDQGNGVAGI